MRRITFLFGVTLICLGVTASASPINPSRPWGDATSLSELQGLFTTIGSTIDAVGDQTGAANFEATGAGNSVAAYVATVSFGWPELEFGIYNVDDPSQRVEIFGLSTVSSGDSVTIQFNQGSDFVRAVDLDTLTVIDSSTYFR